ncbi:MAG TPA: ABC transporter permease, partial [Candidatus Thermoplasmatota archaeon]|nr:ABC transporter permease [Candidatus Thermoplasmatota archaeon]
MTRRVLRQLRRDRRTIAMILVQPIIMMAIFGYALGGDVTEAPVAVANLDRGRLGGEVIARVDPEVVEFVTYTSEAEVERAVRAQEVRVGVVFPVNFTRNFDSGATRAITSPPRRPRSRFATATGASVTS